MNTDCLPALPGLCYEASKCARESLAEQGVVVTEADFRKYSTRVAQGVEYFMVSFPDWANALKKHKDVIKVEQAARSPYNLVMTRLNRHVGHFSSEEAVKRGFIPQMLQSVEEREVLNTLWREWLDLVHDSFPCRS